MSKGGCACERFSSGVGRLLSAATLIVALLVALVADNAGAPLIAVAGVALMVGPFGWVRRGSDFAPFFGSALIVSYAGYIGFIIARIPYFASAHFTPTIRSFVGNLDQQWPLVVVLGIAFALAITVIAGLPMWLIPRRRQAPPPSNAAFWNFVQTQNEKQSPPTH